MTDPNTVPTPVDTWRVLPTDPEGVPQQPEQPEQPEPVVAYGPNGAGWTAEDIRRYWRRTARTTLRAAFISDGCSPEVADDVAQRMERALRGSGREGQPDPLFPFAWDGIQEGLWQALRQPRELLDLTEDETPTLASQHTAVERARHARGLYSDSLATPKGLPYAVS